MDNQAKVSLELVPRSLESLVRDTETATKYEQITHINIPTLARFPITSIDAVNYLKGKFGKRFKYIPHLMGRELGENQTQYRGRCLVVSGDDYDMSLLSVRKLPELIHLVDGRCYVALDQYRGNAEDELSYLAQKIKGGAVGVFTQPFFSIEDVAAWNKKLPFALEVFYGVSPVVSENSKKYWEEKNKVIFPKNFDLNLEKQVLFAKQVLAWAEKKNRGVYLMPIKVSVKEYLEKVFSRNS